MRRTPSLICAGSIVAFMTALAALRTPARAAMVYWDIDGATAGAGGVAPVGSWNGTNWSAVAAGTAATSAWTAGNIAVFSAGTNATGAFTVSITGTQDIGGLVFEEGTTTLTGGTLNLASASDFFVNSGLSARIDSTISGSNALRKTGTGSLRLGATNTFNGTLTITDGALSVTSVDALGTGTALITVSGNTTRAQGGGQLELGGNLSSTLTLNRDLSITGGGPAGDGFALLSLGNNTLNGSFTTTSTTRLVAMAGTTTINGPITLANNTTSQFNGAGHWVLNGGVTLTAAASSLLDKQGGGGLVLNGTNLIFGEVRASAGSLRVGLGDVGMVLGTNGGVLELRTDSGSSFNGTKLILRAQNGATGNTAVFADRAAGSTSGLLNQTVVLSDTSFANSGTTHGFVSRNGYGVTLTGAGSSAGNITFATGANINVTNSLTGLLTFDGNLSFTDGSARTYTVQGNGDSLVTGSILGTGGAHVLAKGGNGTMTLQGTASTYTGNTSLNTGTLAIRGFGSIGGATGTLTLGTAVPNSATLTYLGAVGTGEGETTTKAITIASTTSPVYINASQAGSAPTPLIINGTLTNGGTGAKALVLGGTSTLDNEIRSALPADNGGALSLVKIGGGTWVLSAANGAFTGAVTIAGGKLKVQDTFSGSSRDVVPNAAGITFNAESSSVPFTNVQAAGGTFEYVGASNSASTERVGILNPSAGAGTVKITPTGGSGTAALTFTSLSTPALGSGLNFSVASGGSAILLSASSGFQNAHVYYNGADFAYAPATSNATLRGIIYGTDAGTNTVAASGTLTTASHNQITPSSGTSGVVTQGSPLTINSLKLSGTVTLAANAQVTIQTLANSPGGILATGGTANINGGGGLTTGGTGDFVVRVDGASDQLTLGVPIASNTTGGLTKNGEGKLILGGSHAYTGATTINEGTLQLNSGTRLGGGGPSNTNNLIVRQAGTLDLNGVTIGVGAFNGAGTVTNSSGTGAILTIGNGAANGLFSGLISGNLGITKTAGGTTMALTGANSYTGVTRIEGGTLVVNSLADGGSPSSIGASTNAAANLVFAAGTLQYTGSSAQIFQATQTPSVSTNRLFTLAGNATIDSSGTFGNNVLVAGTANHASLVFSNTGTVAFSGAVAPTLTLTGTSTGDNEIRLRLVNNGANVLSVTKTGAGQWILNPASGTPNTYTGTTTISAGVLQAQDGVGLSTGSLLSINGGTFQSSGAFSRTLGNAAGNVQLVGGGTAGFAASSSKLTVSLGGTLTWGSGNFNPGTFTLGSATALAEVDFQTPIDLGTVARTIQIVDNPVTALDFGVVSGTLSGGVSRGTTILTNTGSAGILYLTGANTYTGDTAIVTSTVAANTLGATGSASSSFGAGGGVTGGRVMVGSGGTAATLSYIGLGETSDREIVLAGTTGGASIGAEGAGPLVLTNVITTAVGGAGAGSKTLTLRGFSTDANELRSVVADNSAGVATLLTKVDPGTWIVSGANTYTGATAVAGGALGVGNNLAFSSSNVTVTNASLFAAGADRSIVNSVLFSGNATEGVFGNNSLSIGGAITFGNGGNTTINNFISTGKLLTFGNTVTNADAGSARTLVFAGTGDALISGVMQNGTQASALQWSSTGLLRLTNTNTYTGNTTVTAGAIQGQSGVGLPGTSLLVLNGGVFQTGVNFTRTIGAAAGNVQWTGSGGFAAAGGNITLDLAPAGTLTWGTTANFISGTNSLIFGSTTADSEVNWVDPLNLNDTSSAVTRTFLVNDNPAVTTDTLRLSSTLIQTGSGATSITKNGAGTMIIDKSTADTSNSFGGQITINAGTFILRGTPTNTTGTLVMTPSATGTNLILEQGAILLRQGTFTANGGAFAGGITISPGAGGGEIRLNAAAPIVTRTFLINDNTLVNDDVVIGVPLVNGPAAGAVHFSKEGAGRLVMSGNNTYAGATILYKGTTVIDYSASTVEKLSNTADLEPRGGTLIFKGSSTGAVAETVGNLSPGSSNLGLQNATPNPNPTGSEPNSLGSLAGTTTASNGGASIIQLQPSPGRALSLTFSGFIRNPGGGVALLSTTDAVNGQFRSLQTGDLENNHLLATHVLLDGRWIAQDGTGKINRAFGTVESDPGLWLPTQSVELNGPVTGSQTLGTYRVAGVTFGGSNATLTLNNSPASLTLTNSAVLVAPESTASVVEITGGKLMTEMPYKTASAADLLLENFSTGLLKISSNVGINDAPQGSVQFITIAGTGPVELAGKSTSILTYLGSTLQRGAVKIIGGATLRVSGGDAISDYQSIDLGTAGNLGGTLQLADGQSETIGGLLAINTNQGVTTGAIDLGNAGALTINQTFASTFAGSLIGTGTLVKQGNATFTSNGSALTFGGALQVTGGLFDLTGNLTDGLTGNITNVLLRGGEIRGAHDAGALAVINKLPDTATFTLDGTSGAGLRITSNTFSRSENVAALAITSSANIVTVDAANTTSRLDLNFTAPSGGLSRSNNATLLVRGDALGTGGGAVVNFSSPLNSLLIGGGASLGTSISIFPWALGSISDVGVGDSFLTNGANGLRPLNIATEYATNYAGAAATDNFSINTSQSGLTVPKIINSLRIDTSTANVTMNGVSDPGNVLGITSGAILVSAGGTTNSAALNGYFRIEAGVIDSTPDELIISVTSSNANPAGAIFTLGSEVRDNGPAPTSITKTGAGTLQLTSITNAFSGGLTINQGVVEFDDVSGRNLGASTSAIRLAGGTLRYTGSSPVNLDSHPMQLFGPSSFYTATGTGATGNALNRGSTIDTGVQGVTIAGPSGSGGIVKIGTGALTIATAGTYTGSTTILQGNATIHSLTGMGGLYLTPENFTGSNNTMVVNVTNTLSVQQLIVGGVFTTASTLNGDATLNVGDATHHPVVTIGNGSGDSLLMIAYHDEGAGNGIANSITKGRVDLSNASAVNINVSRVFIGQNKGAGSGRVDGDLTLSTSGANNVTAGTMIIGNSPGPDNTGAGSIVSQVVLGSNQNNFNVDTLIVGGQNSTGKLVLNTGGSFTLRDRSGAGGANLYIADNDDNTGSNQGANFNDNTLDTTSGTIDAKINLLVIGRHGAGSGGAGGALRFDTGEINAAMVRLAEVSTRGTSTVPTNTIVEVTQDGGTFRFGDMRAGYPTAVVYNWNNQNPGSIEPLAGVDAVNRNVFITTKAVNFEHFINVPAGRTMTFEADAGFDGSGDITKIGAGTFILKGPSSYGGGTEIRQGAILANNIVGGSATGASFVTVKNGGELGGSGYVGGDVFVESGGKLSVGETPGIIGEFNLDNDLFIDAGGVFQLEIRTNLLTPQHDLLNLLGTLFLDTDFNPTTNPTLSITDLGPRKVTEGDTIQLMHYLGGWDGGLFRFNGKVIDDYDATLNPNSTTFFIDGFGFRLDYDAGFGGDSLELIAVPEPGALASLVGGIGMLLGLQRFRRWNAKS